MNLRTRDENGRRTVNAGDDEPDFGEGWRDSLGFNLRMLRVAWVIAVALHISSGYSLGFPMTQEAAIAYWNHRYAYQQLWSVTTLVTCFQGTESSQTHIAHIQRTDLVAMKTTRCHCSTRLNEKSIQIPGFSPVTCFGNEQSGSKNLDFSYC